MRTRFNILILLALLILGACGTKKNTFVHRGYHNLTARFNGYYWSSEAIKEGVYKLESTNKENYEKLLPVFVVPTNESAKATFPDFDKAIKKSSLVIQRHTIKDKRDNEIPTAGKWIDNNWINIGIARYYKREFFSGIEAFDYVVRTYKSKDKYKALLWAAKSYNEIGAVSQADPLIGIIHNDKAAPKAIKSELYAVRGDYYIKRGLYKEAIQALILASNQKGVLGKGVRKKDRARYSFIVAQLFENEKDNKKARQYYNKVISLKPAYDMVFYAHIKLSRLVDIKNGNTEKVKAKLLKMTHDTKNTEYLDVIYFTLGEIEEKSKKEDNAITYFKKSAQKSISNSNQKSAAYLKLGEIYFERNNYGLSEAYYDSTVAVLPKDHPNYDNIVNRKKTLSTLVGYIKTIQREDSLQKLVRMTESERNRIIDGIIAKLIEDEDKQREELEALKAQGLNPLSNTTNTFNPASAQGEFATAGKSGGWYFYNQTTISFGIADFAKKWGNRKLEDDWRRSQKGVTIENPNLENPDDPVNTNPKGNLKPKPIDPRKTREYYIRQLPLSDSLLQISHTRIIESDYLLGATYKEELNNNRRAIAAFEDLNKRYTDHKHRLSCYYQLYRIYLLEKNQSQSDYYKEKLLSEYPKSEYAKLIKNPKYAEERNAQRSEVEKFYEATYLDYSSGNYTKALSQCMEANASYGKTDFTPKFEFIRALCVGKVKGIDSLESALNQLVILYPKSEVAPKADEILLAIKKQKSPNLFSSSTNTATAIDTFLINFDIEHIVLILSPDDPNIANPFKLAIDEFDQTFYSNKSFSISSNLFQGAKQMIMVKKFENAQEAYGYLNNLKTEPSVYKGDLKKELFTFFIISKENLPIFYKKSNVESYQAFYDAAYKTVANQPNK